MQAIYCDTCIYRDYYEWRSGHAWIHYGEEAKKLFERVEDGEFSLVISDHLEYQLKEFPQYQEYVETLKKSKNLIEVKVSREDKQMADREALASSNTEFEDSLHFVLALKGGASILVTDNLEHYAPFEGRIKIRRPEHVGLF